MPERGNLHVSSSRKLSQQFLCLRDVRIWVSTVSILIFLKTEITKSVTGPKLQLHRAEDALAEPYLVQKILVT